MVRLNLALGERDFSMLCQVAQHARLYPGTYARTLLVSHLEKELRRLNDSGELEQFPQADLFDTKKKRGKK